jgi:hypothetical protein
MIFFCRVAASSNKGMEVDWKKAGDFFSFTQVV